MAGYHTIWFAVRANVNLQKFNQMPRSKDSRQNSSTLQTLEKYGVTPERHVVNKDAKVKVIELPSSDSKEYWIGFRNFDVIKTL